jgi:hypothetical protein
MNPCERCIWASAERDGHVQCTPSENDDCGRKQRYQEGLAEAESKVKTQIENILEKSIEGQGEWAGVKTLYAPISMQILRGIQEDCEEWLRGKE